MTTELHQLYRDHIAQAERHEFRGFSAALREIYKRGGYFAPTNDFLPSNREHFTPDSSSPVTFRPVKQG